MKTYRLTREPEDGSTVDEVSIVVEAGDAKPYPLVHRVRHSPTGMNWGYGGSGPADCARSIVWDLLEREPEPYLYQAVKAVFVARLPVAGGEITETELRALIGTLENERRELGGEA